MPTRLRIGAAVTGALLLGMLVGCGGGSPGASPSPTTGGPVSEPPSPTPRPIELTIVVDDGSGRSTTWTLTCDPAGGSHPDPAAACAALATAGSTALDPKPKDVACSQVYGGPEKATVTGTWQGQRVTSSFSRTDGCEIRRWDMLRGLLPSGGR